MKNVIAMLLAMLCGCKKNIHTAFLTKVCIRPYKKYIYHTCEDIIFSVNDKKYLIPKDFQTDLASIPKFMWPIMAPAHSSLMRASIAHDFLYRKPCFFSRKETDLVFYHMLRNDGISWFRASGMFYAVRLFGWQFYGRKFLS